MQRAFAQEESFRHAAARLPGNSQIEFDKKHVIYGPGQPCAHLYFVKSGRVAISNSVDGGLPAISRIVGPGDVFGEKSLLGAPDGSEAATALDNVRMIRWDRDAIEQHIAGEPNLGLALVRYFVQRCAELNARIEAFALRRTPERVMLGLLELAESLGTPNNGAVRLAPLTHQTIAEYVGTSREIVTSQMTELRRVGMLQYSRRYIDVNVTAMRETLQRDGIEAPPATVQSRPSRPGPAPYYAIPK